MRAGRVALLGVGRWGRNHFRVLRELGVLRSVWDRDPATLEREVPPELRADGPDAILADEAVEAVVVATTARSHYEVARRVLDSGRHVLVEKPLTLDEGEGEDLVARARAAGRVLMVGHITLFHPAIRNLLGLVRGGELGNLRYLYANRLNLGTVREEEDILWSFAPHDVAVMLALVGQWPARVGAVGGSYLRPGRADVTVTHLEFGGGVRGHIFVSWLHPMKEHRLVVVGDRRMASFTDGPEGGRLILYDRGVDLVEGRHELRKAEGEPVAFAATEPLRAELEHFLACVDSGSEPLTGGRHGLDVLRVLQTARASLERGGVPLECLPVGGGERT